jgi:hypothetical protein
MLHLVELEDAIDGDDKFTVISRRRKIIASIDITELSWEFARWCALQVVAKWNAPTTVCEYLETGAESLREAAKLLAEKGVAAAAEWKRAGAAWAAVAATTIEAPLGWRAGAKAAAEAAWLGVSGVSEVVQRTKFQEMVSGAFGD